MVMGLLFCFMRAAINTQQLVQQTPTQRPLDDEHDTGDSEPERRDERDPDDATGNGKRKPAQNNPDEYPKPGI